MFFPNIVLHFKFVYNSFCFSRTFNENVFDVILFFLNLPLSVFSRCRGSPLFFWFFIFYVHLKYIFFLPESSKLRFSCSFLSLYRLFSNSCGIFFIYILYRIYDCSSCSFFCLVAVILLVHFSFDFIRRFSQNFRWFFLNSFFILQFSTFFDKLFFLVTIFFSFFFDLRVVVSLILLLLLLSSVVAFFLSFILFFTFYLNRLSFYKNFFAIRSVLFFFLSFQVGFY